MTPTFSAHDIVTKFTRFARDYQGWSRSELARALGRDPTKIIPHSGNPKLDWIVRLAHALDWPIGDLAEVFFASLEEPTESPPYVEPRALEDEIHNALQFNETDAIIALGQQLYETSDASKVRALACLREAIGWAESRGRFDRVIEATNRGLREPEATEDVRASLMFHLAVANLHLWNIEAARALASELIGSLQRARGPMTATLRFALACAHVTRARASLRRVHHAGLPPGSHAAEAADDCRIASEIYDDLQQTRPDLDDRVDLPASLASITTIHAAALRGVCTRTEAAYEIMDRASERRSAARGWSCVHASVLMMSDHSRMERSALEDVCGYVSLMRECAEVSDDWPLRERAWTLEFMRRESEVTGSSGPHPWVLEVADVRSVVGLMGRFPTFRWRGWQILDAARIVRESY